MGILNVSMTVVQKYNSNTTAYPLPDTKAIVRVIIITKQSQ
jgi:hypothetical protein